MRTELVTTLKRQATELLSDIERDKTPILITQHGLPSAYLAVADYIAIEDPLAAAALVHRAIDHVEQLADHPESALSQDTGPPWQQAIAVKLSARNHRGSP